MDEKEMKFLVRNCLKEYYEEDKKILIDISIMQIVCVTYLLYNLIFFGNKIIFSKETYDAIIKESKKQSYNKRSEIAIKNANYLLESINRDEKENYQIVEMESYGKIKMHSIKRFLEQNSDVVFYLSDKSLYQNLKDSGFGEQLNLLEMGKREVDPFISKKIKFETIGAIKIAEGKMFINKKEGTLIKVFDKKRYRERRKN